MDTRIRLCLFLSCSLACVSMPARAELSLTISSGQLMGAKNVPINGRLYDLEFVDGSCIEVFNDCNEPSDFLFNTKEEASAASLALHRYVFHDFPEGNFDYSPDLTTGCTSKFKCYIHTVTASTLNTYQYVAALNSDLDFKDKVTTVAKAPRDLGHSLIAASVFAKWNVAASPPPKVE